MLDNTGLAVTMLVALTVGYVTKRGIILRCVCAAAIGPINVQLLHSSRE